MTQKHKTTLERTLSGEVSKRPPLWIMRQAGRYLPEYKEVRKEAGDFLSLCYNPDKATEVTLQPIKRFDFDAAIMFSDILVIPHALGQKLWFAEGEGPKLTPLENLEDIQALNIDQIHQHLQPVYETVGQIRSKLDQDKTLIGFAGAPWTVACYMIQGSGSKDFLNVKNFMFSQKENFDQLIDILVDATSSYLKMQIEKGVDIVQIFDSWAGIIDPLSYEDYIIKPTQRIVENIRKTYPDVKIIGFARGNAANLKDYATKTNIDGVGLDTAMDRKWARKEIQSFKTVQGNLDPAVLRSGGQQLDYHVKAILDDFADQPFIFNCGHGIIKDTPIAHVEKLIDLVRG